jgi:hypothetical protein
MVTLAGVVGSEFNICTVCLSLPMRDGLASDSVHESRWRPASVLRNNLKIQSTPVPFPAAQNHYSIHPTITKPASQIDTSERE